MGRWLILSLIASLLVGVVPSSSGGSHSPITPTNAAQVTQVARLGRGIVDGLDLNPGANILAVAGSTGIWFYDTESLNTLAHVDEERYMRSVAWSPDGTLLAAGGMAGIIGLWEIHSSTEDSLAVRLQSELRGHTSDIFTLAWSPNGKVLASGSMDNDVRL